jgi:hypothetical protein
MATRSKQFEDGRIVSGEYEGLYIDAIARAMCDSSWDYASFIGCFAIDEYTDIPEYSMYVMPDHLPQLAVVFDIAPDDYEAFVRNFPDDWDT